MPGPGTWFLEVKVKLGDTRSDSRTDCRLGFEMEMKVVGCKLPSASGVGPGLQSCWDNGSCESRVGK